MKIFFIEMAVSFFKPFIGKSYFEGIYNKIKVLVLGESHYCTYNKSSKVFNCIYWDKCTSTVIRDSSPFNNICPYYNNKLERVYLHDTTIEEMKNYINGNGNISYNNFFNFLSQYFEIEDKHYLCDHLAFMNYVQFFLPSFKTPILSIEDKIYFSIFLTTIEELKPDIIIIWGTPIVNHFNEPFVQSMVQKLQRHNNHYFWTLIHKGRDYLILNPYHPCDYYKWWSKHLHSFKDALDVAFKQIDKNY